MYIHYTVHKEWNVIVGMTFHLPKSQTAGESSHDKASIAAGKMPTCEDSWNISQDIATMDFQLTPKLHILAETSPFAGDEEHTFGPLKLPWLKSIK